MEIMSDEGADGGVGAGGPTLSELVAREREVLEAIEGVTSVSIYERQQRQALNMSMIKVRMRLRKNPFTIHCSANVPDLLVAAHLMLEKMAKELGTDAVAEGRQRAEAAREAAAPVAAPPPAATEMQPASVHFFEHAKRVAQLEAEKRSAEARVRDADGHLRSALLLVKTEEKAVKLAQQRLADAQAAAETAQEPLSRANAAVADIRASLEQLRSKRQRLGEEQPSTSADAEAAQTEAVVNNDPPHYDNYKDYTLATFRTLEAKQMLRRSVVPKRGVQAAEPRRGKDGAMENWRHGLVGGVQAWALGSLENVVKLVLKLIQHFQIAEAIRELLPSGVAAPVLAAPSLARATAAN